MDINVGTLDFQVLRLLDENGAYIEYDLKTELQVNEANLLKEMLEQPAKYIYWASVLERLKLFQERKELDLEIAIAQLDQGAREYYRSLGEKPTKDMVDSHIKRQPEYLEAKQTLQHFDHVTGRMQRIVKALEQRKDMLQSYGKQIADQRLFGKGAGSQFERTAESPFDQ